MKYKVLKECVIESKYHAVGDVYYQDRHMALKALMALIDNGFIEGIEDELWAPEYGEPYWFINNTADILRDDDCPLGQIDKQRVSIGNCFRTKEQAEKAVAWLEAFKVLREDAKGFKPNWGDTNQNKWLVFYCHDTRQFIASRTDFYQSELVYFATEADAEESIKNHRQEWLTFFGVGSE